MNSIPSSKLVKPVLGDEWMEVGKIDDIPRLGARIIRRTKGDIALFRTADDEFFALLDRCPHKGGPLSQGIVHGKKVTCPLHSWNIELECGEAVAPDVGCVPRYEVKVEAGMVYLNLKVESIGVSKKA